MSAQFETDAVIVGGGVGGSSLATVLARNGIATVVIERERVFRDRVRGEGIHPWGYRQAIELGLEPILKTARANPLPIWQSYRDREPVEPTRWDDDPENDLPELAVSHPGLQEASLVAAEAAGAAMLRGWSARRIERIGRRWEVTLEGANGERARVSSSILIGADGRDSAVRRWLGIGVTIDPTHHRFGGLLIEGCALDPERIHAVSFSNGTAYVMPQGAGRARVYCGGEQELTGPLASDRSGQRLIELLAEHLPDGAMGAPRSAGPIAFFPNGDIVPEQITGDGWALIGDAAGANDPSVGQGLSMTYRDVRRLSELLMDGREQARALDQYAAERRAYHATAREHARWIASITMESGELADERRAGVRRSKELDATQGGFAFIYTRGPMGLVADDAARRHFFGESQG